MDMQHDNVLKKLKFNLLTPTPGSGGGGDRGSAGKIFVAFMILFNLCNMTMFWQSWNLTFWPHCREGVCGQNICYQVAAFVKFFISICKMTMFWKSWSLTYWPHPKDRRGGGRGCSAFGTCSYRHGPYIDNICLTRAMTDAAVLAVQIWNEPVN